MTAHQPDPILRFAIERLLQEPDGWRSLVRDLARGWPQTPALELTFVLVSAAEAVTRMFDAASPAHAAVNHAYRLAALIGVDLYAMSVLDLPRDTAGDLHAYWASVDPYFLRL